MSFHLPCDSFSLDSCVAGLERAARRNVLQAEICRVKYQGLMLNNGDESEDSLRSQIESLEDRVGNDRRHECVQYIS